MLKSIAERHDVDIERASDANGSRTALFKADRPRSIDEYIDYFGSPRKEQAADACETVPSFP